MSVHVFHTTQKLPVKIEEAWKFFSSPHNLSKITPPDMNFVITSKNLPDTISDFLQIQYLVTPMPGFRTKWATLIKKVNAPHTFTDEQLKGPYKLWRHQHTFKTIDGGVEMDDFIEYEIPFGALGDLMNKLLIRKKIESIFQYREKKLNELFGPFKN